VGCADVSIQFEKTKKIEGALSGTKNKTPPSALSGRASGGEMSRYAEDETVLGVPPVLRARVVAVELQLRTEGVEVKDVRVTVGVRNVRDAIRATAQREGHKTFDRSSGLYFIRHLKNQCPSTPHHIASIFCTRRMTLEKAYSPDAIFDRLDSACRVAEFGRRKAYPPADSPSIQFS